MKRNTTPIIIAILIPSVSIILAISLIYFKKKNISGYADFPYQAYIYSPTSLVGNTYLMKAQMDIQLAKTVNGRVIAVTDSLSGSQLALLMPNTLKENISAKQRYEIVVRVDDGGRIVVESLNKY